MESHQSSSGDDEVVQRLAARPAQELAEFIALMATEPGLAGDPARAFLLADRPERLATELQARIERFRRRCERGDHPDVAELSQTVTVIEQWLLPRDRSAALLCFAAVIELDGPACEAGLDDWDVATAIRAAIAGLLRAADGHPEARAVIARLRAEDAYGLRSGLADAQTAR